MNKRIMQLGGDTTVLVGLAHIELFAVLSLVLVEVAIVAVRIKLCRNSY